MKDWTGNSVAYSKTLGASNHSSNERETHDYYATEPKAVKLLLQLENFSDEIWECACGELSMTNELVKHGKKVFSTDIIKRCDGVDEVLDFLSIDNQKKWGGCIITNPPYKYADQFIVKAMSMLQEGKKLALFLPIRYLEGKARKEIYKVYPPKTVHVSSSRLICAINGEFDKQKGSAVSYAWFIFEKGFTGNTILKWFN